MHESVAYKPIENLFTVYIKPIFIDIHEEREVGQATACRSIDAPGHSKTENTKKKVFAELGQPSDRTIAIEIKTIFYGRCNR